MTVSLATLLVQETKAAIYSVALSVAQAVGLPVTSWEPGDPTRSFYHLQSEILATLEEVVVGFISSGFLDYATGDWLKLLAKQVFNVDVPDAVAASTTVLLTNTGGGNYPDLEPGDITFKSSTSGKTFRNTTGGALTSGPGTTLSVTVVADEPGAASSAGAGEIDTIITGPLGATCSNALAAIGIDEQSAFTTVQQCRDKLGSFSPNGPKEAYSYVARNSALTGTTAVTRVRPYPESDTGDVTIYLAGPSGGVAEPDRALVETAILMWATPLCITPTVLAASSVTIAISYELWVYKSCNKTAAEVQADVLAALEDMISARPIGGDLIPPADSGAIFLSMIESTIRAVFPQCFRVNVTLPATDTFIGNGQVATLGVVTGTVNLVVDP